MLQKSSLAQGQLDSEFGYEVDGPHVNVIPEELIILKLY
jgi:hypothetical protein